MGHTVGDGAPGHGTAGASGERLRRLRHRAGLTQRELAERSGISVRALRDIEQGRVRRPQALTVRRLADSLGLDEGGLAGGGPDEGEAARPGAAERDVRPPSDGLLRIGVLGTLSVRRGGRATEVRSPKLRRLLALLALRHPEPTGPEEVARALWPGEPPRSYRGLIHTYVGQARALLRPSGGRRGTAVSGLVRTHGAYALSVGRDQVDLTRFEDLSARARQARAAGYPAAAYELAGHALACWRGPLLADEPLLGRHPAATAAVGLRVESVLLFADLAMELRRRDRVVRALRAVAEEEPLHEGVQARLMLVLAGCGEQSEALRVFADTARRLDRELGVEPGEELRRAHLRVLRQELPWLGDGGPGNAGPGDAGPGSGGPVNGPAGNGRRGGGGPGPAAAGGERWAASRERQPPVRPSQLPAEARGCVGRERQVQELDRALLAPGERVGQVPVALVTGPPGVGKTALALRWAHRARDRFPDGQLYADLHGYSSRRPLGAVEALTLFLRALGVPGDRIPDDPEAAANLYRSRLAGRRVLVVLDNARRADQVRPLIPGDAGCAVLVTGRNTLSGLVAREGARRLVLDALGADDTFALLTRLLGRERVEREPSAAMVLGRLCGGLPLAVRIAAACLAENPRTGIARYCVELGDGGFFRGLRIEGDPRSCVGAAFDTSYAALPAPARRLFPLLAGVPDGDISAHTAAALAGTAPAEALRTLHALADESLLRERARGRFAVPDLLRRYARALAEREAAEPPAHPCGRGAQCAVGVAPH